MDQTTLDLIAVTIDRAGHPEAVRRLEAILASAKPEPDAPVVSARRRTEAEAFLRGRVPRRLDAKTDAPDADGASVSPV